jgi:hypothetical protein
MMYADLCFAVTFLICRSHVSSSSHGSSSSHVCFAVTFLICRWSTYTHTHINSNTHVSLCLVHKYTYIGAQIHLYWCINARIYHAYVQSSVGAYVHVCAYSVYLS